VNEERAYHISHGEIQVVQGDSSFTPRLINPIKNLHSLHVRLQTCESIFPYHFIQSHKIKQIDFDQIHFFPCTFIIHN
jgi:hypothetical protein